MTDIEEVHMAVDSGEEVLDIFEKAMIDQVTSLHGFDRLPEQIQLHIYINDQLRSLVFLWTLNDECLAGFIGTTSDSEARLDPYFDEDIKAVIVEIDKPGYRLQGTKTWP